MVFPDEIESLDFRFQGLSSKQSPDMFIRLWGKKVNELRIGRNRITQCAIYENRLQNRRTVPKRQVENY